MDETIKILYIWISKYGCLEDRSFNFSTQYKFNYDSQTKTITVGEKNSKYIDNFFGENIDITAVVGQNGTGKTTLLRFIQGLNKGELINTECVFVCEHNGKFCAAGYYIAVPTFRIKNKQKLTKPLSKPNYHMKLSKFHWVRNKGQYICKPLQIKDCKNVDNKIVEDNIKMPYEKQRFFLGKYIRFIYLTETFNMNQYTDQAAGCDDLSFASVLYSQSVYGDEEKHITNPVVRYIHRINDWQLAFFSNGREYVEQFKIKFPKYFFVELSYDQNAFTDYYLRIISESKNKKIAELAIGKKLKADARKYENDFLKRNIPADNFSLKDEYATAIFMNIITSLQYVSGNNIDKEKILFDVINQVSGSPELKNAWETVKKLLKIIKDNNDKYNKMLSNENEQIDDKIVFISVEADKYIDFMDYLEVFLSDENESYSKQPLSTTINISTKDMEDVRMFFNNYKECVSIVDFLSFSWGLSSGENILLNQFGKLMHLLKIDNNGKYYLPEDVNPKTRAKNAIILLDEAEAALHPEWQRIYFDAFLKFVKKNISEQGTHVQIILATHSPIILSDIPRQNTIFLKKDENNNIIVLNDNKETFAANIFSLYQNAFFLNESGIGEFAEKKLCELISKIHRLSENQEPSKSSKNEIIREIECIGDPYIRHKFETKYENVIGTLPGSKLDAEIEETKKRLAELKKRRRKLGCKNAEN